MSIRNAIFLLNAIDNDLKLREQIYGCIDYNELMDFFKSLGYIFDDDVKPSELHIAFCNIRSH